MQRKVHWGGIRPHKQHSNVLIVAGMVYVGIGLTYMFAHPTESRAVALEYALRLMSLHYWGVVFLFAGVLAIVSSRWPPISKTWGYMVLTGLSAGWAGFYFVGMVFGDAPYTYFSSVMTWGLIAFLWWAISGLLNPDDIG